MKLTVTTPPTGQPVTYALAATQLRLTNAAERDYVSLLIDACTQYAQDAMNCSLITQTLTAEYWAGEYLALRGGPVQSITSVSDANGAITNYTVERHGYSDVIVLQNSFAQPLTVVYQAGYGNANSIPAKFQLAILTHVATLYLNRASVSEKTMSEVPNSLSEFYRLNARKIPVG